MARREVIEIQCDRCSKVETQAKDEIPDNTKSDGSAQPELLVRYHGKKTVYDDLCRKCRRTVENYLKRILMIEDEKEPGVPEHSG